MGNSHSFWPPGKLFQRKSSQKKKSSQRNVKHATPAGPMYDTVADFPVYSVVDKGQRNIKVEENVQYAEIEVIPPHVQQSRKKPVPPPKPLETEYATINFPKPNGSPRRHLSSQPSDARHSTVTSDKGKLKLKFNATNGTLV